MLYFFLPKLGVLFEVLLVSTGLGLSTGLPVALYLLLVHNLLFPLGLATNRIAKFSGDLAQLALRARTVRVPTHCAYRSLQNPNPIIRYFAVQALVAGAQEVKFDWLSAAAGETWYPLYQAYLRMAISQLEQSEVLTHLSVMLETNAEDPRLILAISTLAESQFRPIDPSDLTKVVLHGQLLAHGIFEKVIQPTVPMDQDMHPLAGFAATYVGPASQNRWAPLAARFREGGQLWKDGLEGPVRMELSSPELELIFTALSPYRDLGLASFYELRVHRFYVRLYRFFAEIRWLAELGDVRLSDSSEP